jgi:hypothetical protein
LEIVGLFHYFGVWFDSLLFSRVFPWYPLPYLSEEFEDVSRGGLGFSSNKFLGVALRKGFAILGFKFWFLLFVSCQYFGLRFRDVWEVGFL